MWYYDSLQFGCTRITKANIAIPMIQIYQYQPNTQTKKDFHAQYLKKIFQYSKKHKNFKRTKEDTIKTMK
jgi:hypothetical protein